MTFPIYGKIKKMIQTTNQTTHYLNLVRISWTRKQELAPILYNHQPPTGGFDLSQRYQSILQLRLTALSAVITLHVHLPCLKSSSDIFSKCKSLYSKIIISKKNIIETAKQSPETALGLRPRLLHDHFQDEHDLVEGDEEPIGSSCEGFAPG